MSAGQGTAGRPLRKCALVFLAAFLAAGGSGFAREIPKGKKKSKPHSAVKAQDDSGQNLAPIEFRQIGPDNKPSQDFFYKGKRLENHRELSAVVDALGDPEASKLLKDSEGKQTAGTIFNVGGGLLVIGSIIYGVAAQGTPGDTTYLPFGQSITHTNPPDLTPTWILGGAGAVVELVGIIFTATGEQNRRDAVNRYNHQVAQDRDLSMNLGPLGLTPELVLTQRF